MNTQVQMSPPKPPVHKKIAAGFPDDIRSLGDEIASAPKSLIREVAAYISQFVKGLL